MKAAEPMKAAERRRGGEGRSLLRILGPATGLAIAVGGTIASGIFRTPGVVAAQLGDAWLVLALWALGGLVFVCGALTYAELGTRYPESGGLFTYIRRAYGDGAGAVYGWLFAVVIGPATGATLAVVFGEYAVRLSGAGEELAVPLAGLAILVFWLTNYVGLRWGAGVQNALTVAKVVGLGGLVIWIFLHSPAEGAGAAYAGAERHAIGLAAALALAFQSVIWAFDGYSDPLKVGEEIREPERNLPRSLVGGVLVITAVYLAVNAAFLWAVPLETMARSNLVAADAAVRVMGERGGDVIALLAIVSVLGTLSESLLVNSRIAYATARAGLMPAVFTRVNRGGSPTVALAWNAGLAFLIALSGTFEQLLAVLAFALTLGELATTGSIFVFRRRDTAPPPFRVPAYPLVPLVFLVVNLGVASGLILLRPREAGIGAAVAALAALGYVLWRRSGGR